MKNWPSILEGAIEDVNEAFGNRFTRIQTTASKIVLSF